MRYMHFVSDEVIVDNQKCFFWLAITLRVNPHQSANLFANIEDDKNLFKKSIGVLLEFFYICFRSSIMYAEIFALWSTDTLRVYFHLKQLTDLQEGDYISLVSTNRQRITITNYWNAKILSRNKYHIYIMCLYYFVQLK